mmetsp:Transcript_26759/g.46127  ORF Transcript_26759/g.46127 Transcript_26759/m.46127 type:complete len:463 (-) Transcript_26759:749-2137(-)
MLAAVTRFGKSRSRKSIYGTGSGKFKRVAILLPLIFLATVSELYILFGDDSSHQQDDQSLWSPHGRPLSTDGFRRRLHSVPDGSGSFGASTPGTHHPVDALYIWPDVVLRATSLALGTAFPGSEVLRYSLRSLEMYAPWINRVFIVVPDPMAKIPTWLDESNSKLKVIALDSTATIDQLPQISEHFLFFAEPYVLVQDVTLADFASQDGAIMLRYGPAVTEPEVLDAVQKRYPYVTSKNRGINYTAGAPFLVSKHTLREIPGTVALSHPLLPIFYATHVVHVRQNLLLLDAIRSGKIQRSHLMESCHASEFSSESRCFCRENPRLLELCICRQSGWLPLEMCSPYHAAVQECRQSVESPNRCKLLKEQQESCPAVFRSTQNCSLSMVKYKTLPHPEDSATTSVAEVADDHVQFHGIMWKYFRKRTRFLTVRQDSLARHAEFAAAFSQAMNERYPVPSQFEIR